MLFQLDKTIPILYKKISQTSVHGIDNIKDLRFNQFSNELATRRCIIIYIRATTRQNVSSGVSDQARHKPACAATEAS